MNYRGWSLDPVTKNDHITVRCRAPNKTSSMEYVAFNYTYSDVRNIKGACEMAKDQIDILEEIISTRCETTVAKS